MAIDLGRFGKSLNKGAQAAGKPLGSSIPDGRHKAQVKAFDIVTSKAGDPMFRFRLACMGYGEPLFKSQTVRNDEDAERVGKDLGTMGLKLRSEDPNEIFDRKDELVGIWIEIEKKTKPDGKGGYYLNVYINKKIEAPDPADVAAHNAVAEAQAAASSDDDDIPF
jgi:hypothetical protein